MKNLVFFIEGQAEKAMLEGLLPRLFACHNIEVKYVTFQGKQDLEAKLCKRLKGWRRPDSTFMILLDQDREDCQKLKQRLVAKCKELHSSKLLIRIACHELESWYFGDLSAVEKALEQQNIINYANKQKYRRPDHIEKPSDELAKITNGIYQKISGSRAIGEHLSLEKNTSPSFQIFIKGIQSLVNLSLN